MGNEKTPLLEMRNIQKVEVFVNDESVAKLSAEDRGMAATMGQNFSMILHITPEKDAKKYGKIDASKRIIATTDAKKGALRTLATNEGYRTFIIPDDVGGRFSVLTPVGLLPIGAVGIDIMKLLQGAQSRKARADLLCHHRVGAE